MLFFRRSLSLSPLFIYFSLFLFFGGLSLLLLTFSSFLSSKTKVCFLENCFLAKKLVTKEQKIQGLAYQKQTTGALMIFPSQDHYSINTQKMNFLLDVFWINEEKKVVATRKNLPPCKKYICPLILPKESARYILETKAGIFPELNTGAEVYF
jgi:uncharacterized membrane protein (UPF0127 family)